MITESQLIKFGELIRKHTELYPNLPVKAENFESLISSVIGCEWKPNNHNQNADIITEIDGLRRPSLKSGIIKNNTLTISSHRTTKYKTLQGKLNFLDNRTYDSYLCLSRPHESDIIHSYHLIYFEKNLINFNSLNWHETINKHNNHSGWEGHNDDKSIVVKIIKSMSDQVWITLNLNLVNTLMSYEFKSK